MKLDIYAHCTMDAICIGDARYVQTGGPACYCGHTATGLKFDVMLHTRFGPDFDLQILQNERMAYVDGSLCDTPTTRFRIQISGTERDLYLEQHCECIPYEKTSSDGILASPVFSEISEHVLARLSSDSGFLFLDPQGFLRRTDDNGHISLEETRVDLSGVSAIKVSPDELFHLTGQTGLQGMKMLQKQGVSHVLFTDKRHVTMLEDQRMYTLKIPNMDVYDTTGIGDIFSATFTCTMLKERDSMWAFCFAGGSVQAALEGKNVGVGKVPHRNATATNASYFYNTLKFESV